MMNEKIYFTTLRFLNSFKGTDDYSNTVIATGKAKGFNLTEDWLNKHLLFNIECGLIGYEEGLKLKDVYMCLIEKVNNL